jgi:2'-5' RNA ligase
MPQESITICRGMEYSIFMVRAFVALELSETIRDRLAETQPVLRTSRARLTFVDPKLIHITVKFLGEVDDALIPKVKEALGAIRFSPFPVTARKIAVNNPKRPFTVWCTIEDSGQAVRLFRLVEDALAPLGFRRESRPFTPHATVARVKRPDPTLFAALGQVGTGPFGDCIIGGLKLKKSTLTPQGPVYDDLMEVAW